MRQVAPLIAGILFGFGLAWSGMTDTHKVLGFLDIFGQWDYDLAFVMGGALLVSLFSFQWIERRGVSLTDCQLAFGQKHQIDRKLISGAVIFGIGWGLYGYCPGPAISSVIYGDVSTWLFVGCMALGMWLQSRISITS